MKAKIITLFLLCFWALTLHSQISIVSPNGAKGIALGGIHHSHDKIDGIYGNPASMAWMQANGINLSYQQKFAELDLRLMQAGFVYGSQKMGSFGLQLISYGIQEYKEQKIALSYGRKLINNLSIGAEFSLISLLAEKYGNVIVPSSTLGLYSMLTKEIFLGASVHNVIPVTFADNEQIPLSISFGLQYQASEKVYLIAELFKSIDHDPELKVGVSYQFYKDVAIQLGFQTNPASFTIGVSYQMNDKFNANLASAYHPILGLSPAASINFQKNQVTP